MRACGNSIYERHSFRSRAVTIGLLFYLFQKNYRSGSLGQLLGVSEITANLYCNCVHLLLDFQHIFVVIYEPLCISILLMAWLASVKCEPYLINLLFMYRGRVIYNPGIWGQKVLKYIKY